MAFVSRNRLSAFTLLLSSLLSCSAAQAQVAGAGASSSAGRLIAAAPTGALPGILPTDVTPTGIGQERSLFQPGPGYWLNEKLPARLWFNFTNETSQRLETNVFQTTSRPMADYVFRETPNITLGYNVLNHTSIYTNYFMIKDVYLNHDILTQPTTQSLSLGFRHDIPIGMKSNLQLDFQARELWQAKQLNQADLLPSITYTHAFTPNLLAFASAILQMRSHYYFEGPTREIDPFYSIGTVYRRGRWTFSASDTFVNNFRNNDAIPKQSNLSMIADLEAAYPLMRRYPSVQMFMRAEPIFNICSQKTPGLSGFDFRLYSGLRYSYNKPSYGASISNLRNYVNETARPKQTSERLHHLLAMVDDNRSDFAAQLSRAGYLPAFGTESDTPTSADRAPSDAPTEGVPVDVQKRVNSAGMLPQW